MIINRFTRHDIDHYYWLKCIEDCRVILSFYVNDMYIVVANKSNTSNLNEKLYHVKCNLIS